MTNGPSAADRVQPVDADAPVVGIHFLRETAVFVLGEEALLLVSPGGTRRVSVHAGAILCSASDGKRVITGGDDGKLAATDAGGTTEIFATDAQRRWIDHVAISHDGALAWSAGKTAFARSPKGNETALDVPSTVGGLAFARKGFRLAVTHYNGVSLWFPNARTAPERLEWKGSHLGVSFSRDMKFLVTAMQEPTLHGWRLPDGKDMRMSGYSAPVRSMDWSADGSWLATSGSEQLILWPFRGKDGPMGKQPRICGVYPQRVTAVACHPRESVAAVGYADGLILLVHIEDGREILVRKPDAHPVTALGWQPSAGALAFGTDDGKAGILAAGS